MTSKPEPGDFDAGWERPGVAPGLLDPILLALDHGRQAQKLKFGGELIPFEPTNPRGAALLQDLQWDVVTRTPKGIIRLDLEGLP